MQSRIFDSEYPKFEYSSRIMWTSSAKTLSTSLKPDYLPPINKVKGYWNSSRPIEAETFPRTDRFANKFQKENLSSYRLNSMIILSWKTTSLKRSGRPPSRQCDTQFIGPFKHLLFLMNGHDRYEYIPKLETLTIPIPGWLHERPLALTTEDLQGQLRDSVSQFRDKNLIVCSLLEKFEFRNSANFHSMTCPRQFRSPDQQITYIACPLPRATIEISHSQNFHNLRQVAHDSILMTNGNIRIVTGVDMRYYLKDGLIADRLLMWELVKFAGSPPYLSSVCTFDKVSLQFWPLCEMPQAKLI